MFCGRIVFTRRENPRESRSRRGSLATWRRRRYRVCTWDPLGEDAEPDAGFGWVVFAADLRFRELRNVIRVLYRRGYNDYSILLERQKKVGMWDVTYESLTRYFG